eukprot:CAMPEP_0114680472 /NCGR_PEP_ID=MMETSP0191-20121206/54208_1 /TAXON_ID=126664 /ORGANISM="Sorites sp." /LENGTH=45 /DNA_ID= /DNA_START= /DNA_END= /DNA_ORIENTATION=
MVQIAGADAGRRHRRSGPKCRGSAHFTFAVPVLVHTAAFAHCPPH